MWANKYLREQKQRKEIKVNKKREDLYKANRFEYMELYLGVLEKLEEPFFEFKNNKDENGCSCYSYRLSTYCTGICSQALYRLTDKRRRYQRLLDDLLGFVKPHGKNES